MKVQIWPNESLIVLSCFPWVRWNMCSWRFNGWSWYLADTGHSGTMSAHLQIIVHTFYWHLTEVKLTQDIERQCQMSAHFNLIILTFCWHLMMWWPELIEMFYVLFPFSWTHHIITLVHYYTQYVRGSNKYNCYCKVLPLYSEVWGHWSHLLVG